MINESDTNIHAMEYALINSLYRRRIYEILDIASKGDLLSKFTDIFLISLILLSVLAIILESVQSINDKFIHIFYWFEIISITIFSIEYILRVWTCVESKKSNKSKINTRIRYMLSLEALIDLLAILPFYLLLFGISGNIDMRFLRSFRLLRVLKLTRYSAAFDVLVVVFKENIRAFGASFLILLIVMLMAATGMYYFEHETQPVAFSSIPASMWWAFSTLTTVGYGDVTPFTAGGKVFGAIITVLGIGMVALPAGILASAFSEQLRMRSQKYKTLVDEVYEDGMVTEEEKLKLETLREELDLGKEFADEILVSEKHKRAKSHRQCPHCGKEFTYHKYYESNMKLSNAI